ncbi:methyl-accepting chemotaxis protein [Paenibacillus thalictri]|uniref:Methyl-accepting chemotaxis protein n=1 Tax=Paenibacillus thalictri TaxID=2527873 RepID=A0A4Q9DFL1_9BACL|nr:methyl-accepting chemotaxis protein [Paenibacillus thalictri]TBL70775.1 methyl-accepting chemotaxis protein [Paenibacillus thalictri]
MIKFTVGKKLGLSFLSVLLCVGTIGAVSTTKMMNMGADAEQVQTSYMPSMKLLGDMKADFINVERLTLRWVMETDAGAKEKLRSQIDTAAADIQNTENTYKPLVDSEQERVIWEGFLQDRQTMSEILPKVLKAGEQNDSATADKLISESRSSFNSALERLEQLIDLNEQQSAEAMEASANQYKTGKRLVDMISIAALVLTAALSWFVPRIISRPIVTMARSAKRIAAGDLTAERIDVKNRDEIGDLAVSFNEMTAQLRSLIREVQTGAKHVAASSEELNAGTEQISKATEQITFTMEEVAAGTERQARNVDESAKSIGEMSSGIRQIARNAESANSAAMDASELAAEGNQTIRMNVKQMNSIQDTVERLAEAVEGLSRRSQEIGRIVDTITGIAQTTNLLALNASIEAARVGEHGSGFAVVAREVRKLAEQTADSAKEIALIITDIQAETGHAVQYMKAGTKEVAEGIVAVRIAGEAFDRIQRSVNEVAGQIQEVSAASQQLSASSEQVVHSIGVIADVAETTSAGTQHVSTAVEEQLASMQEITNSAATLSVLSEQLQTMIVRFRV